MAHRSRVDVLDHDEDQQEIMTGEAVALDLRSTGFVLRGAGAAIDYLLYFGGYVGFMVIILNFADQLGLEQASITAIGVAGLVIFVVVVPTAVETATHGKSLGRLAVGARIVRDDGGSIGFRHALIRALLGVIETFMTFGALSALVGMLNGRAKRLGDLVAGTYSQNERVSRVVAPVYGVPVPLIEWSRTADVARLPDALARRVAQFLAQAGGFTPATRARLSRELAAEVSVFVSPVPAVEPELFLAGAAALRRDREIAALTLQRAGLERLEPVLTGIPRGFPDRG